MYYFFKGNNKSLFSSKFLTNSRWMNSILFFLTLIFVTDAIADTPIVYSRCKRTTAEYDLTGEVTVNGVTKTETRRMKGLDVYDQMPDVTNFLTGFTAPCDLVYRNEVGAEEVIYNCSSNSTDSSACAALDPAVSFDGNLIAFTVFRGNLYNYSEWGVHSQVLNPNAEPANLGNRTLPNKYLSSKGAHLHFYDLKAKSVRSFPYFAGVYDTGPAFISTTRIAFTSTRDGNTSTMVFRTNSSKIGTRIWSVDLDGRNLDLSSHHSLSQEQHPYMLKNGRLAYSSWQIFGGLPFRHNNGTSGSFTTIDNLFHIYAQDPDGAENFPIYGQHSGDHQASTFGASHTAAHFMTETSDGRVWFADYYRGNNNGLGHLVGVIPEPKGMEGKSPYNVSIHADMYVPNNAIDFAPWSKNSDIMSTLMSEPRIIPVNYIDPLVLNGKVGHPAALPNNGLMVAWGKGPCSTVMKSFVFAAVGKIAPPLTDGNGSGVAMNLITSLGYDMSGCDLGIYRATSIPSKHPGDLQAIVDSRDWHEIMARAVVPYSAIHGVPQPQVIARADKRASDPLLVKGTPFGLLGAASIIDRETLPRDGFHFEGEHQFHLQGTDTIRYSDSELCGVRILGVSPNRSANTYQEIANIAGERVSILGEFSVLNYDSSGNRIMDKSNKPDTSFLVRMPANTPYLMQSIDCNGRTLNTDQTWQHLRPGEKKTCNGCHVHARQADTTFAETFAATINYKAPKLGEGIVPLLSGKVGNTVNVNNVSGYGMTIEFNRDILPIFQNRCTSCHGESNPAAGLALGRSGGNQPASGSTPASTWWCLVADFTQRCVPSANQVKNSSGAVKYFRRPQLTRYIRGFNSRGSLLYWKAANQRADNITDDYDPVDINFGASHPTGITSAELGLLSRWIDIGAPGGGVKELKDTQKPTLNLVGIVSGDAITGLIVGTNDLGSGINPSTLKICILDNNNVCTSYLTGSGGAALSANMHGTINVTLPAPLNNAGTQIKAEVKDMSGNLTEVYRSVAWLTDSNTAPPPTGDTTAPTIAITSPQNGASISNIISVNVSANDSNGVSSVELYVDGSYRAKSTQSPFTISLDTKTLSNGNHNLVAYAIDPSGNRGASPSITIGVSNTTSDTEAPTIAIVSPTSGAVVSGVTPVEVLASDNVGVSSVSLSVNGAVVSTSTAQPFTTSFDSTKYSDGAYSISVKATDIAGNSKTSNSASITIKNTSSPSPDTEAPSIQITSPVNGSIVSGIMNINVSASDNVGIVAVDYYVDGQYVARSTQAPFSVSLNTLNFSESSHALNAKAIDQAQNSQLSSSVGVTVKNSTSSEDTQAPTLISFNLSDGMNVSRHQIVRAEASDNVGIAHMELYIDGQLVSFVINANVIEYRWNKQKPSGLYFEVKLVIKDTSGNTLSKIVRVLYAETSSTKGKR